MQRRVIQLAAGLIAALLIFALAVGVESGGGARARALARPACGSASCRLAATGIHKIKHVVIIMQENRSFDNYFGTYPGADGIPMRHGTPTVCEVNPKTHVCVRPFHDTKLVNQGGPHAANAATADINGGRMNGFEHEAAVGARSLCIQPDNPACLAGSVPDVMGYHTAHEIPNYWAYARRFVLQDHLFEPAATWSLPAHLYMVSEWSAICATKQALSCTNNIVAPQFPPDFLNPKHTIPTYAWTDLTYLLYRRHISWSYYVTKGKEPDCESGAMTCTPAQQNARTPGIWNPLPYFETVHQDRQLGNIQPLEDFFSATRHNRLPAVSWIAPSNAVSEHPPSNIAHGQTYVTRLINTIMGSREWDSTAIFLSWDDWGGFYDNVRPPTADANGFGIRVPGLVISPYARRGYIDHHSLSQDAYVAFIENDFLGGQRINPRTDGRPDRRPDVRETLPQIGSVVRDFNFEQRPGKPFVLPLHPRPG